MKRLLAYLFIVLGLGLVFSANANEKILPDTYPENQYEFATEFLKIGDYNNAEKAFREFVITNPNHKLAGNAQYWYAETFRVRQLWTDAASAYLEGYQKYPKSEKAPINLLKLGVSLVEIGEKDQGCLMITGVEKQYPKANQSVLQKIIEETRRYKCKQDTQIAKAEPSQTQEVEFCILPNKPFLMIDKNRSLIGRIGCKEITMEEYIYNYLILPSNDINRKLSPEVILRSLIEKFQTFNLDIAYIYKFIRNNPDINLTLTKYYTYEDSFGTLRKYLPFIDDKQTQIAKVEPTIKPEKKVAETTQEEFKPEDKDIDNDAPVIEIAEAITVNDSDYEFEGKVTDKSKQIFIEVDGRLVDVKKGKFTVKGYSPVDKEISIQAIDGYGNRSKPKIVKLIIDIKDTDIVEKLEPLNPSKIRAKVSKSSRVALIIGIENYAEAPKANYANLDAKYFFDYARRAFGVKKQNINLLVNEEATVVKTDKALSLWLKSKIKKNKSDLIIFFAGHGLASSDGKELYLLPQDGNPDRLERTALSRTDLFKEIINLNPKSVTMFLDTCYSGVSRDEQMLLASARPIRIVADEQEGIPDNFTIFSASKLDQISSGLKEVNHGIFSYFLMKGLEGKADSNNDKKITNGELLAYMNENVSQKASELGRQQNPSLAGDPNKILMSYR